MDFSKGASHPVYVPYHHVDIHALHVLLKETYCWMSIECCMYSVQFI